MPRTSLKTECLYCGYPFGQGEHKDCLKRIRKLEFIDKADTREKLRQLAFLQSKRYRKPSHPCPRCGTPCRWRGKLCHAHTRAWVNYYGGNTQNRDLASQLAVRRLEGAA